MAKPRLTRAQKREVEEAAALAAHEMFLTSVPQRLFELQELAKVTPNTTWTVELTKTAPKLRLVYDDGNDNEWTYTLSDESDEWEFNDAAERLERVKAEHDRQVARRNAAAELRKTLTPDQLALLREFGV